MWRLLVNIAVQDKSENIPPNVAGDFMRSVLNGSPYPESLLQAAVRRIKSDPENRVKPVRAALIKAFLNRDLRAHPDTNKKEIAVITSYSIHYTKLYEAPRRGSHGARF